MVSFDIMHQMEIVSDFESTIEKSVIPFLLNSIDDNNKCFLAITQTNIDHFVPRLRKNPKIHTALERKQIEILDCVDFYFEDGVFDISRMMELIRETALSASEEGYPSFNYIGDAHFICHHDDIRSDVIQYELILDPLAVQYDVHVLCLYNDSMDEELLRLAQEAHYARITDGKSYFYTRADHQINSSADTTSAIELFSVEEITTTQSLLLLMDDDPSIRQFYEILFSDRTVQLLCVATGRELIDIFIDLFNIHKLPDLIISDLKVAGGMDGDEACKILRSYGVKVPIILSTGAQSSDVVENYNDYGFNGLLRKPFTVKDLIATIDSFIQDRSKNEEDI